MSKIPQQAKKVFVGELFDVYQWEQEMFDGTTQTFEMLKRPDTVEIIATEEEKILLSRQSQPNKHDFYSLFGGRVESNEDPLKAAKRELLEESGYASGDWEVFKRYEPLHKIEWTIYTYIARNCKKIAKQKLDAGEKIEIIKCNMDELFSIVLSEKYWGNEMVEEVLKMKIDIHLYNEFKKRLFG